MADQTSAPWLMLFNELKSYLSGGNPNDPVYAGLQLLPEPLDALWDDPVHGTYIAWEQWSDAMPKWGPTYIRKSNDFFSRAYGIEFLHSLRLNDQDPVLTKALDDDGEALKQASQAELSLRLQAGRDWKEFDRGQQTDLPASEWLTYAQWYQQSGYLDQVGAKEEARLALVAAFAADTEKAVDPDAALVGQAILDYENKKNFWRDVSDLTGAEITVPSWEVSPDLATWLKEAAAGQGKTIDLTIDHNTSTTTDSSYSVDGVLGIEVGFFGFAAGGSYTHHVIDTTSSDFSMTFTSAAFTAFPVSPSGWYSGNVVNRFKNGPFKPGRSATDFFGPSGVMNVLPTVLYLAYQPTITLTLVQHDFEEVKSGWTAGAGIMIGPFAFGGKGSGQNDTVSIDDSTRSLTVKSNSPHPMVMAVLNNVLP